MNPEITPIENRVHKSWWVVFEHTVVKAVGYSCAPNSPDSWWFPQIGYTMQEGHHVFGEESKAIHKALSEIDAEITRLIARRDALVMQSGKRPVVRS